MGSVPYRPLSSASAAAKSLERLIKATSRGRNPGPVTVGRAKSQPWQTPRQTPLDCGRDGTPLRGSPSRERVRAPLRELGSEHLHPQWSWNPLFSRRPNPRVPSERKPVCGECHRQTLFPGSKSPNKVITRSSRFPDVNWQRKNEPEAPLLEYISQDKAAGDSDIEMSVGGRRLCGGGRFRGSRGPGPACRVGRATPRPPQQRWPESESFLLSRGRFGGGTR